MPENKRQMMRIYKLLAAIRERRHPNAENFVEELRRADLEKGEPLLCSARTIQRDLQTLKNEYGAPIVFNKRRSGYELSDPDWQMEGGLFDEGTRLAAILGARLASQIFPDPLKSRTLEAVERHLAINEPKGLALERMRSMLVFSKLKARIDPKAFMALFDGWRFGKAVEFAYRDKSGRESSRVFEPHVLAFNDFCWYAKGFCHESEGNVRKLRTFAVHRMKSARLTESRFDFDENLLKGLEQGDLFGFERLKGPIVFRCSSSILDFLRNNALHERQTIEECGDGHFLLNLPDAVEDEIMRWVLFQGGDVEVVSPVSLRQKVRQLACSTLEVNR